MGAFRVDVIEVAGVVLAKAGHVVMAGSGGIDEGTEGFVVVGDAVPVSVVEPDKVIPAKDDRLVADHGQAEGLIKAGGDAAPGDLLQAGIQS